VTDEVGVTAALHYPGCIIDPRRARVERDGMPVELTPLECSLIDRLAADIGKPVSASVLLTEVWGYSPKIRSRAVASTVTRLRKKLEGEVDKPRVLLTVRGVGFMLAPVTKRTNDGFFGRRDELRQLAEFVRSEDRLATLVGIGGMGKTTLARRFAATLGRPWTFVDAADAQSFDALWAAVGRGLEVPLGTADPSEAVARLTEAMSGRSLLLILDNVEQCLEPAADLVRRFIDATTQLRVLTTSREPLRLMGERVIEVGPLHPDDATALFRHRTERARGPLTATSEQAAALVSRLDCVPLAIELAAPRAARLAADELLIRLDEPLDLRSRKRDRPERHRSLRASVDGSWQRLDADLQHAVAQCGVFPAPFSLGAAEAVLDVQGDPIDVVDELCERSWLQTEPDGRYRMLAPLRAFARERLAALDHRAVVHRRHAEWYTARGRTMLAFQGVQNRASLTWLVAARLHLRAIWELGEPDHRAQAALLLHSLLGITGPESELLAIMDGALSVDASPVLKGRLLKERAATHAMDGEPHRAANLLERAIGCAEAAADAGLDFEIAMVGACLAMQRGDLDEADRLNLRALSAAVRVGDPVLKARALNSIGEAQYAAGDLESLRDTLYQALADLRPEHVRIASVLRGNLFCCEADLGHPQQASAHLERASELAEALGDLGMVAAHLSNLASVHRHAGQLDEAEQVLVRCGELHRRVGQREQAARTRVALAMVCADGGRFAEALESLHRLLGRARKHEEARELVLLHRALGVVHHACENLDGAAACLDDAARVAAGHPRLLAWVRGDQARLCHERGDLAEALAAYAEAQSVVTHGWAEGLYLSGRAAVLADLGDAEEAAAALVEAQQRVGDQGGMARAALGVAEAHVARAVGARGPVLPACAVMETTILRRVFAAGGCGERVDSEKPKLTPREAEVVGLVAEGLSNRQITERLGVGLGTVKTHVHNVLKKLNASTRAEAVVLAQQLDGDSVRA